MNQMKKRNLRGSGRTWRMIKEAFRQARMGNVVYIVVSSLHEISRIKQYPEFRKPENQGLTVKVDVPESLGFDWYSMSSPRAHSNCVFLVDHLAIEDRFRLMLNELHRFEGQDEEAEEQAVDSEDRCPDCNQPLDENNECPDWYEKPIK